MPIDVDEVIKDWRKRGLVPLGLAAYNPVTNGVVFKFLEGLNGEAAKAILEKAFPSAALKENK